MVRDWRDRLEGAQMYSYWTAVQEVSPVGLLTVVFCWAVLKSGSTGIPRPAFESKKAEDVFRLRVCRAVSAGL